MGELVIADATQLHPAELNAPPSKSDAHRAFAFAWMLGLPEPRMSAWPKDVRRIADGLKQLGKDTLIDCGDGAAPFRILLALAAVTPGRTQLTGTPRLAERPHEPLYEALGLEAAWPMVVEGRRYDSFSVEGELSSQYVSALVIAACSLKRPFNIELVGPTASRGYLDITLRWARAAGFSIDDSEQRIAILGHVDVPRLPEVPPDWSSLGYLLLMAKASGSTVDISDAKHPDSAVLDYLNGDIDADVSAFPDLAPTLAALALAGSGGVLRNVSILRHKESDRLEGIMRMAQAVGGTATLDGEVLRLTPGTSRDFSLDCKNDHRMTLSAVSLACLLHGRAELTNAEGVDKSFPGFFDEAAKIGVAT